jgi:hypothetical protein
MCFGGDFFSKSSGQPGANPAIVSYNVASSLVRFENKIFSSML